METKAWNGMVEYSGFTPILYKGIYGLDILDIYGKIFPNLTSYSNSTFNAFAQSKLTER